MEKSTLKLLLVSRESLPHQIWQNGSLRLNIPVEILLTWHSHRCSGMSFRHWIIQVQNLFLNSRSVRPSCYTVYIGCCYYTSSKLIKCCLIWVKWEQLKRLDSNLLLKLMESWTIGKQRWGKLSTWGQSRDSYPPHELGYFLCQRGILVNYEILIHLPHLKYPRAEDNGTKNNLNRII